MSTRSEKPPAPAISHILQVLGLLMVALDIPLFLWGRSVNWRVTDGVVLGMVVLFIGGLALVGLGALIRVSTRRD